MKGHSILFIATCWMLVICNVPASVLFVDVNSTNPLPPYTGWGTASTDIQSAIDVSTDGDLILVTTVFYSMGGRVVYGSLTNRVVTNKAVTVQSVNGPELTIIQGTQPLGNNAVRCVYMTNNAILAGFTLTNGGTIDSTALDPTHDCNGGGAWCESTNSILLNCVLAVNTAQNNGCGVIGEWMCLKTVGSTLTIPKPHTKAR